MGLPESWIALEHINKESSVHARYKFLGNAMDLPTVTPIKTSIVNTSYYSQRSTYYHSISCRWFKRRD